MLDLVNSKRARKRIAKAKASARPELSANGEFEQWTALGLAQKLDINLEPVAQRDTLQRISVGRVTKEQFVQQYERPLLPVVISDVAKEWPARHRWTLKNLLRRYRNQKFKCGEDDQGYNVKLKLKYFVYYMKNNCDDSPLYIFDGNYGEHRKKKRLLDDYTLPIYFQEDLFKYAGNDRRPPYRWIVIGPARSGTGIHIDPLGTSAWNTLLVGYKRWCLFPTYVPRDFVKVNQLAGGKQCTEAVLWFKLLYPRTQESTWPELYKPIEVLQRPGETVFVPSGWWHVVMNLTDTVAVTQNFVSTTNFPIVWHKTVRNRPKLSQKWLAQLAKHRPDLAQATKTIDINTSIGITSDSSSGSSSSSSSESSSSGSCDCSSCMSAESSSFDTNEQDQISGCSDDSGKASLSARKKSRRRSSG